MDSLDGGLGDDVIRGGPSADRLYGGGIYIGGGNDLLFGGRGADRYEGSGGSDKVHGGRGSDFLRDTLGRDVIKGGVGSDACLLTSDGMSGDRIVGGPGADEYAADPGDKVRSAEIVAGYDACTD